MPVFFNETCFTNLVLSTNKCLSMKEFKYFLQDHLTNTYSTVSYIGLCFLFMFCCPFDRPDMTPDFFFYIIYYFLIKLQGKRIRGLLGFLVEQFGYVSSWEEDQKQNQLSDPIPLRLTLIWYVPDYVMQYQATGCNSKTRHFHCLYCSLASCYNKKS